MPVQTGDATPDGANRPGNNTTDPTRGTVVLLDDDAYFRQASRRLLQNEGFAVFEAEDISSFLRILDAHHVDVVVADSVLGDHMDGWKEVKALATRHPVMKVVYVSGYDEEAILEVGGTPVERHYQKGRDGFAIVQAVIEAMRE
jgi:DNA-binding NarL/FixJ family response regulator